MGATTAAKSPRYLEVQAALDRKIQALFPGTPYRLEFGMKGWKIARPTKITGWTGTIDPNFIHIYLAERKTRITLHLWNSYDPGALKRNEKNLTKAGFKVMVGCLQFNRKGDYPIEPVFDMLDNIRSLMDSEK